MSRQIPRDRALTDEERTYLLMRGEDSRIATQDQQFPPDDEVEDVEGDNYEEWTVAELQAEIKTRVEAGSEITPASSKKADLVAALRANDAEAEDEATQ